MVSLRLSFRPMPPLATIKGRRAKLSGPYRADNQPATVLWRLTVNYGSRRNTAEFAAITIGRRNRTSRFIEVSLELSPHQSLRLPRLPGCFFFHPCSTGKNLIAASIATALPPLLPSEQGWLDGSIGFTPQSFDPPGRIGGNSEIKELGGHLPFSRPWQN